VHGAASRVEGPERDLTTSSDKLIAGQPNIKLGQVSTPRMHLFLPPTDKADGGAVLVLPGGGFGILARSSTNPPTALKKVAVGGLAKSTV
jgi:hypothetical protein